VAADSDASAPAAIEISGSVAVQADITKDLEVLAVCQARRRCPRPVGVPQPKLPVSIGISDVAFR
jgi:hypothetical protein